MQYFKDRYIRNIKTCKKCGQNKSLNDFRLKYSSETFEAIGYEDICRECQSYKRICLRCAKVIDIYNEMLKVGSVGYCRRCFNVVSKMKHQIELIKIHRRIQRLINSKMPKTISHLREELFEVIKGLKSGEVSLEIAAQICDTAKVIIDSARVENEFIQLTELTGSGFIPQLENASTEK